MKHRIIKHILFLIFLSVVFTPCFSTEKDSLLKELEIGVDIKKPAIYSRLSEITLNENNIKQSKEHALNSLEFALKYNLQKDEINAYIRLFEVYSKLNNDSLAIEYAYKSIELLTKPNSIAEIYKKIGVFYFNKGKYILTENFFLKQLEYTKQSKDTLLLANNYFNLAYANLKAQKYEPALDFYKKSLLLYIHLNERQRISDAINDLGILYRQLGKHNESLKYFLEAEQMKKKLQDIKGLANVYNNIGNIYWDKNNYDEALEFYNQALEIRKKLFLEKEYMTTLNNIANVYTQKGESFRALYYLREVYKNATKINDRYLQATALLNLANAYKKVKQYSKAYNYLLKAENLTKQIDNPELKKTLCIGMVNYHKKNNNYRKAFYYQKKLTDIQKTLITSRYQNKSKELKQLLKYETDEQQSQILKLSSQLKEQNRHKKWFILYSIISSLTLVFVILYKIKK